MPANVAARQSGVIQQRFELLYPACPFPCQFLQAHATFQWPMFCYFPVLLAAPLRGIGGHMESCVWLHPGLPGLEGAHAPLMLVCLTVLRWRPLFWLHLL